MRKSVFWPYFGQISSDLYEFNFNRFRTKLRFFWVYSCPCWLPKAIFLTVLRIFAHVHLFGRNSTPAYPIDLKLYHLNSGDLAGSFSYPQAPKRPAIKKNHVFTAEMRPPPTKKMLKPDDHLLFFGGSQDPLWQLSAIIGLLQLFFGSMSSFSWTVGFLIFQD